ncbi:hypothetical protein Dda_4416 [Drechslerella dactyloides]|uniref:Peptidase S1 domain-containing protein n=1 Tax=Drechslerella dactyloides TaxID=74499 RepID=A0AAD6IXK0_DREDA|nr:hypothetical protein Dda_4416 [Drechslerella dactyloides]
MNPTAPTQNQPNGPPRRPRAPRRNPDPPIPPRRPSSATRALEAGNYNEPSAIFPEEFDIRRILCSPNIELYNMTFHKLYAKYRLLLSSLLSADWRGSSRLYRDLGDHRKRRLRQLISAIESSLYHLCEVVDGKVLGRQQFQIDIGWKPLPANTGNVNLLAIIQRAVNVYPIYRDITLNILSELDGEKTSLYIGSKIQELEKFLAEYNIDEATFQMKGVPDMVGWSLENLSDRQYEASTSNDEYEIQPGFHTVRAVDSDELMRETGQWRGIVKLLLRYSAGSHNQPSSVFEGTGWLVDKDTIATSGHCVFTRSRRYLISVDVHFAPEHPDTSQHSMRVGTHVVVHWGWYKSSLLHHDLAFIRLNSPQLLQYTKPIKYMCTPRTLEQAKLEMRGYPGSSARLEGDGLIMYSASCTLTSNLDTTANMLEYPFDTYEGVHHGGCRAFGAHSDPRRPGRLLLNVNQAVTIDKGANDFDRFREVLAYIATGKPVKALSLTIASIPEREGFLRYTILR